MSAPAECLRIGDNTLKVPVPADLVVSDLGLGRAIQRIPREWKQQISRYSLDRAFTDEHGQRWFLIKVVWRMP